MNLPSPLTGMVVRTQAGLYPQVPSFTTYFDTEIGVWAIENRLYEDGFGRLLSKMQLPYLTLDQKTLRKVLALATSKIWRASLSHRGIFILSKEFKDHAVSSGFAKEWAKYDFVTPEELLAEIKSLSIKRKGDETLWNLVECEEEIGKGVLLSGANSNTYDAAPGESNGNQIPGGVYTGGVVFGAVQADSETIIGYLRDCEYVKIEHVTVGSETAQRVHITAKGRVRKEELDEARNISSEKSEDVHSDSKTVADSSHVAASRADKTQEIIKSEGRQHFRDLVLRGLEDVVGTTPNRFVHVHDLAERMDLEEIEVGHVLDDWEAQGIVDQSAIGSYGLTRVGRQELEHREEAAIQRRKEEQRLEQMFSRRDRISDDVRVALETAAQVGVPNLDAVDESHTQLPRQLPDSQGSSLHSGIKPDPMIASRPTPIQAVRQNGLMKFDVFISHASEDKEGFVRPLFEALTNAGIRVWLDESRIGWGEGIGGAIDRGMAQSNYGIVVLSSDFLRKPWPQRELEGLVQIQVAERRIVILPIYHGVTSDEVRSHSLTLAAAKALDSSIGIQRIVSEVNLLISGVPNLDDGEPSEGGITSQSQAVKSASVNLEITDAVAFKNSIAAIAYRDGRTESFGDHIKIQAKIILSNAGSSPIRRCSIAVPLTDQFSMSAVEDLFRGNAQTLRTPLGDSSADPVEARLFVMDDHTVVYPKTSLLVAHFDMNLASNFFEETSIEVPYAILSDAASVFGVMRTVAPACPRY